jgi:hypothetical protein
MFIDYLKRGRNRNQVFPSLLQTAEKEKEKKLRGDNSFMFLIASLSNIF